MAKYPQSYETTIASPPGLGLELQIYVLPQRSFANGQVPSIDSIIADLKLTGAIDIRSSQLASALSAIMSVPGLPIATSPPPSPEETLKDAMMTAPVAANFDFAEYAAYADIVPVETSPLEKLSLANIWEGAKTVAGFGGVAGAGCKLGLLAVGGAAAVAGHPVLIIVAGTVGVVSVAMGAATGTAIGNWIAKSIGFIPQP